MNYLGVDVGSLTTKVALIDSDGRVIFSRYRRTSGRPVEIVKKCLDEMYEELGPVKIAGMGATGSARKLIGMIFGADVIKNEITAHAFAALTLYPETRTIIEIGGQDSKLILLKNGVVTDFAMNTICAAGTGSFLDQQASRLGLSIEEFSLLALRATSSARIAGRCTVFAESDMIHKQQMGISRESIVRGLCDALVRNYLANLGHGKKLESPILFQGGVAANKGIVEAFKRALSKDIIVPEEHKIMGALGIAFITRAVNPPVTNFRHGSTLNPAIQSSVTVCNDCPNMCEIVKVSNGDGLSFNLGGRCGKWEEERSGDQQRTSEDSCVPCLQGRYTLS